MECLLAVTTLQLPAQRNDRHSHYTATKQKCLPLFAIVCVPGIICMTILNLVRDLRI